MKSYKKQNRISRKNRKTIRKNRKTIQKNRKTIRKKNRKQLGKGMDENRLKMGMRQGQFDPGFSENFGITSPKSHKNIKGRTNFANSPYYYMISEGDTGIKGIYKVTSPDPSLPSQENFIDIYLYIPSKKSLLIEIIDSRGIYVVTPEYLNDFIMNKNIQRLLKTQYESKDETKEFQNFLQKFKTLELQEIEMLLKHENSDSSYKKELEEKHEILKKELGFSFLKLENFENINV